MIYMVENGFEDPLREAAWNAWYTEHVTHSFLGIPGWRTGQRFVALPPTLPKYRAMYTWDSADVMDSPEYKATTGGRFPDAWRAHITDFHRNLADGEWMPPVARNECLVVVDDAGDTQAPDVPLTWWNVVGMERSVARRAIAVVDRPQGEAIARRALRRVGVYAPLFDRYVV